jgi:hypothetical protein
MRVRDCPPFRSDERDVVAAGGFGVDRAWDLLSEPPARVDRDDRVADVVRDECRNRDLIEAVAGIERGEARSLASDVG